MLSRFNRMLLQETSVTLAVTCGLIAFVFWFSQLFKLASEVMGLGLSLGDLLLTLPYALPTLFTLTMPVAFLLSLLIVWGRLAEERELIAMAASGVATWRLFVVPLIMATGLTGLGLYLAIRVEPVSVTQLKSRLVEAAAHYFAQTLEPDVIHDNVPDRMIYFSARDPQSGMMRNVMLSDDRDPAKPLVLTARTGRIEASAGAELVWSLQEGELYMGRMNDPIFRRIQFDEMKYRLDTSALTKRTAGIIPSIASLSLDELRRAADEPTRSESSRRNHLIFYYRKFAFPLANFAFALIALPLATVLHRPSRLRAYLTASLFVGLYLFMAQSTDELMARLHIGAALATFLPPLLLMLVGSVLMWRRLRN